MANSYFDRTGVLIFNGEAKVTPVIAALFAVFDLDLENPVEGKPDQVFFKEISEENNVSWESVAEALCDAADQLGVKLPDGADDYDMTQWLLVLSSKFGVTDGIARRLMEEDDFEGDASPAQLYKLAMQFNDGHNLAALEFSGGWHSDKPSLNAFGGTGGFVSKHVEMFSSSGDACDLGRWVTNLLDRQEFDDAGKRVVESVQKILGGIRDDEARARITKQLIHALS